MRSSANPCDHLRTHAIICEPIFLPFFFSFLPPFSYVIF
jgi:hypothetical protein